MTDCVATAAAPSTGAAVDPQTVLWVAAARCTPLLAAIGDDRVARVFKDVGGDEVLRSGDECGDLLIVQLGDEAERIHALDKADF